MNEATVHQDGNALTIERTFNGTIDQLWKFYAEKDWFEKWWGPEGWETTAKEFNFEAGGRVHYDMHCVDKNQGEWFDQHSWGVMLIESVDEPNSFAYTDALTDETGEVNQEMPSLKTVVRLAETDGKTIMTIVATAESPEQVEELLKMGMVEGFSSQMSKLDALLETM